jgi:CRISPR-associated protein Cas1
MEGIADKSLPIEDIGYLVLDHEQITISHRLLDKLLANNTAIITCNEKHHPTGMFLNLDGNTVQSERFRVQVEASEPLKKQLWQQTIKAKIKNQKSVLDTWSIDSGYLQTCYSAVKSGDSDNQEAKASLYYWHHLFPKAWKFSRKREGAPPNNLLNYGYSLIRASVARGLVGSGLLPTLGIFHRNRYNAYCLADDIMEPYRPYVDRVVREIVDHTSHITELNKELKSKLLSIPTIDIEIDNTTKPLMLAIQTTTASLAKCYLGEARKISYPNM